MLALPPWELDVTQRRGAVRSADFRPVSRRYRGGRRGRSRRLEPVEDEHRTVTFTGRDDDQLCPGNITPEFIRVSGRCQTLAELC